MVIEGFISLYDPQDALVRVRRYSDKQERKKIMAEFKRLYPVIPVGSYFQITHDNEPDATMNEDGTNKKVYMVNK